MRRTRGGLHNRPRGNGHGTMDPEPRSDDFRPRFIFWPWDTEMGFWRRQGRRPIGPRPEPARGQKMVPKRSSSSESWSDLHVPPFARKPLTSLNKNRSQGSNLVLLEDDQFLRAVLASWTTSHPRLDREAAVVRVGMAQSGQRVRRPPSYRPPTVGQSYHERGGQGRGREGPREGWLEGPARPV